MTNLNKTNFFFNFELLLTTGKKKSVEVKIQFLHHYSQSTMKIANYFRPSERDMSYGPVLNSTTPGAS